MDFSHYVETALEASDSAVKSFSVLLKTPSTGIQLVNNSAICGLFYPALLLAYLGGLWLYQYLPVDKDVLTRVGRLAWLLAQSSWHPSDEPGTLASYLDALLATSHAREQEVDISLPDHLKLLCSAQLLEKAKALSAAPRLEPVNPVPAQTDASSGTRTVTLLGV